MTDLLEEEATGPDQHPLDMVERFVTANAWACERLAENEIAVEIEGRWCAYRMWFGWEGELDALMLSCAFDLKVPEEGLSEICRLLAYVNERLWVGHFDLFSGERVITYRHALLLGGHDMPTDEQLADLIDITISESERFYPAFQYVIGDGKSAEEAVSAAIIDPVGEA